MEGSGLKGLGNPTIVRVDARLFARVTLGNGTKGTGPSSYG